MNIQKSGQDEGHQAYLFEFDNGTIEIRSRESLVDDREGFEAIIDGRTMNNSQLDQIRTALDRVNNQISLIDETGDE